MFSYNLVRETIDAIVREFRPEMIIVFGSVAKGTADEYSDLDLLVVMDTDLEYHARASAIYRVVYRIPIPKDIIVLTPEEFESEKENPLSFVSEIVRTGRVFYEAGERPASELLSKLVKQGPFDSDSGDGS